MKRGQSAIEFLSTYSWSLFGAMVVIASLVYFGALNPERFIPEHCIMPSGINCIDFEGNPGSMKINLRNALGFNIINVTTALNGTGCDTNATGPASLINGAKGTYTFVCTPTAGKFQGTIRINYVSQSTLNPHKKYGDLLLNVRE